MEHDCIIHSVVENSKRVGPNTFRRERVCKVCSKLWITIETNKGMASHSTSSTRLKIDRVINSVCENFGVSREFLLSRRQPKNMALVRHIAMYLCREAGYSYPAIAKVFDNRDHTSVLYAYRKIRRQLQDDKELKKIIILAKFHYQNEDQRTIRSGPTS